METSGETIFTPESTAKFHQLNDVVMQGLLSGRDIALVDMPEILLRMKIGASYSLKELQDIFNVVMNKLAKKEGPCMSTASAALYYFPEVFA